MTNAETFPLDDSNHRLVRYFHDCLAAQTDWGRAINVVDQQDVYVVPLAATEQRTLGTAGCLTLNDPDALELTQRFALGGIHVSLFLGALFLVGRLRSRDGESTKRFCAPLLEVPVTIQQKPNREIEISPEEQEFTINYGLIGELLRGEEDDLQDRLADLAQLTPDFPIDPGEFDAFWNGFRMIAPEVEVSTKPPSRRRKADMSTRIKDLGLARESRYRGLGDVSERLDVVDFFIPQIPKDDAFRLLPATAIVLGRKAGRSMSALSELRAMEDMPLSTTAFGCVFDPTTARTWSCQPTDRAYPDEVQPLALTPTQQAVVESSRSAPLTVVTGPPGTGKSYTITAIVLDALLNGESVLVASQMDKAVEVVAEAVEGLAGSLAMARSGGRAAQRQLAKKVSRLTGARNRLDPVSSASISECGQRHYDLTRQQQQLEKTYQKVIAAERQWSRTCQTQQQLQDEFPFPITDLDANKIRKAVKLWQRSEHRLEGEPGIWQRLLASWERARVRRILSVSTATKLTDEELTLLLRVQLLRLEMRDIEQQLQIPLPADHIWEELTVTERSRQKTAIELLRLIRHQRLQTLVTNRQHRAELRDLATLLRRRQRDVKRQLQQKLSAELLLESFPAWACTSRTLCEILPATPGLFDLVVIDEASQCDLALAAVALMRGKRAVVVGDPQQLRHVCFLSHAREQAALMRSELAPEMAHRFRYRRSLFDVAADTVDQRHIFFLDEHFRSHPQIIEFSNQRFYDSALQLMTSRPTRVAQSAIQVEWVDGRREIDSSINRLEVEAVVATIRSVLAGDNTSTAVSIGVVSPFRDHADAIKERLVREYSPEVLLKHSIIVGTAHSLQGDEKDVIIFSTSIDANSHSGSLRFLESPHLFNVAITRARRRLLVVTSVLPDQLPTGLLRDFLLYATVGWMPKQTVNQSGSIVELQIADQLQAADFEIWTGFRSAGQRINIVAMGGQQEVALLCDDCNDRRAAWDVLQSQRSLARAGWRTIRIPHRSVVGNWHSCLQRIADKAAG